MKIYANYRGHEAMRNLSGKIVKGYELREFVGSGNLGMVYRAYQPSLAQYVAFKIVFPYLANHPQFILQFETEAQRVARLEHAHIVPLYDYWRDQDGAYLVTGWMSGGSLQEHVRQAPFNLETGVRLVDQLSSALSTAHTQHVVHGGVNANNILLDEDGNYY